MRLYHGSAKPFGTFDEGRIGEGAEPNSALGIWLTPDASIASSYGRGRAVMVVEADEVRLATCSDPQIGIWGAADLLPGDREIAWPMFEAARADLSSKGYDGVVFLDCDETMTGTVCIFRPEKLRIVTAMPYPEGPDFEHYPSDMRGCDIDRSETLEDALAVFRGAPEP